MSSLSSKEISVYKWTFNPPHASHMAGSWERMIGIARKILEALLLNTKTKELTHEVSCTFMCEVTAIMNSRPICPISTDPVIISPSMLLTQKDFSVDLKSIDFHSIKDMYISQLKNVQYLSNIFWELWRDVYLQNLQVRRKWQNSQHDLNTGDVASCAIWRFIAYNSLLVSLQEFSWVRMMSKSGLWRFTSSEMGNGWHLWDPLQNLYY